MSDGTKHLHSFGVDSLADKRDDENEFPGDQDLEHPLELGERGRQDL